MCAGSASGAGAASATNYTLWIHGRNSGGGTVAGTYNDFRYWGPATASAGVNKKAVNWDGVSSISATNGAILNALDCYCTGTNWCYIAAHSAGDYQIGYALSLYGGSTRQVKNATPNSAGVCGNTTGNPTQVGWNIRWVAIASGASGGRGGLGMSATTLYQWVGMSSCSRLIRSGVIFSP